MVANSILSMRSTSAIKSLGSGRIGGYLVRWGDPKHRDVENQYFTPETELGLDWYSERPMLYHHGLDNAIDIIGVIDTIKTDTIGVWAEGQLDLAHKYFTAIMDLVKRGILHWSSGSLPQLAKVTKDGFIAKWPIVEGSLTPAPAEPRPETTIVEIKAAYKTLEESGWIKEVNDFVSGKTINRNLKEENIMTIAETIRQWGEALIAELTSNPEIPIEPEDAEVLVEEVVTAAETVVEEVAATPTEEPVKAEGDEEEEELDADGNPIKRVSLTELYKILDEHLGDILPKRVKSIIKAGVKEKASRKHAVSGALKRYEESAMKNTPGSSHKSGMGSYHAPNYHKGIGKEFDAAPLSYMIKARTKHGRDDENLQSWYKAQSADIGPRGGFIGEQAIREDLIDQLRPQLMLEKTGALITTVSGNQSVERPRLTASPEGEWLGEGNSVTEEDYVGDMIIATPKPVAGKYALPISLLGKMRPSDEATLRNQLTKSIMIAVDKAALRGAGTKTGTNSGGEPLGILNTPGVSVENLAATARKPAPKDMDGMVSTLLDADVPLYDTAHWVYTPRVLQYFKNLTDTTGQKLAEDQWKQGYEPITTNTVLANLGGGSDTRIYFGEWSLFEMVMSSQIEIVTLDGDTYTSKLQVGVMAYMYVDFIIHHPEAFAVRNNVSVV